MKYFIWIVAFMLVACSGDGGSSATPAAQTPWNQPVTTKCVQIYELYCNRVVECANGSVTFEVCKQKVVDKNYCDNVEQRSNYNTCMDTMKTATCSSFWVSGRNDSPLTCQSVFTAPKLGL